VAVENAGYGATAAAPIASLMAEKYLTGTIADTWERRYWRKRLHEEVRSAPDTEADAPASPSPSATQAAAQPPASAPDSPRPEDSSP